MHPDANNGDGVLDTARRFGSTILSTLRNRFELVTLEAQEEGLRTVDALLLLAAIIAAGHVALLALIAGVVILLWSTLGVWGLFIVTALSLAAAVGGYLLLRSRIKTWQPFAGTIGELKKDREWLAKEN